MIVPTKKRLTIIFASVILIFNASILIISYVFLQQSIMSEAKRHMREDIQSEFLDQYRRAGLDPIKNLWDEHFFQILNKEGDVLVSTRNSDTPASARATTMAKSAMEPFDANHLWPSSVKPLAVRVARVSSMRGSEPTPGAGSVIAKQERLSPATRGSRKHSRCLSLASACNKTMSGCPGAAHCKAVGPRKLRPATSR